MTLVDWKYTSEYLIDFIFEFGGEEAYKNLRSKTRNQRLEYPEKPTNPDPVLSDAWESLEAAAQAASYQLSADNLRLATTFALHWHAEHGSSYEHTRFVWDLLRDSGIAEKDLRDLLDLNVFAGRGIVCENKNIPFDLAVELISGCREGKPSAENRAAILAACCDFQR